MSEPIFGHIGDNLSLYCQSTIVTLILIFILHVSCAHSRSVGIPRVGKHPMWSGLAVAKQDFVEHGAAMIDHGYHKHSLGLNTARMVPSQHSCGYSVQEYHVLDTDCRRGPNRAQSPVSERAFISP